MEPREISHQWRLQLMQIKMKIGQHSLIIITIDYPVAGFKVSENNFL